MPLRYDKLRAAISLPKSRRLSRAEHGTLRGLALALGQEAPADEHDEEDTGDGNR
jgi:hypothetical protein